MITIAIKMPISDRISFDRGAKQEQAEEAGYQPAKFYHVFFVCEEHR
jgi:hypothetical protein